MNGGEVAAEQFNMSANVCVEIERRSSCAPRMSGRAQGLPSPASVNDSDIVRAAKSNAAMGDGEGDEMEMEGLGVRRRMDAEPKRERR